MPELPEVETVRRGLTPAMEGRRILRAEARRPDLRFPFPERFAERLTGTVVERLDRRSKYLLARLGSGETLLMHLGMSGRFSVTADDLSRQPGDFVYAAPANPTHDHVVFHIEGGVTVTYNDPRRFGFMTLYETDQEDIQPYLKDLGPEPLSNGFSEDRLNEAFKTRRSPVKAGLLDQSVVAGLGNIYVCEALWRSKISPRRLCNSIPGARAARLAPAVRDVIAEAIEAGGSTLRDYAGADGAMGYFQHRFDVYGREGEPCHRCEDSRVERIVQSGRSSFFCPSCQR
ncbi:MAG: bifunctional DNA-formamidopyrimidine glycosylase/DNA-(apurinic or apyrimidinic site) lyase [Oceanicaulis sp.]|jgi:formamidopyrimidine-DNA glycosylase|uniref:bifunctional DNA-formamidopyrimidine glycosylase/DNA-(apurinic or apyrimidinic site) lyase n=1 Tax=Oceanicaulis alexandrii TaxID=153233 RepID=UPI001A55EF58|nr:bifunctional DNA-formamidopyrimidine glycosylase/DNA-(apurinic or apyrimidinic site) lyase [Oceanicaulis alexandrii]MBL4539937.1 bifunctional DNA-formamidopyrimidine glycosylase/DNA-(apurinic or apyrimidinic site) lyase [Oceanicaulis sp.]